MIMLSQPQVGTFMVLYGQAPGAAYGSDVDEQGNGTVTDPRLYQLIRQPKPIVDRRSEEEALFVQVRHRLGFKRLPAVMRYV